MPKALWLLFRLRQRASLRRMLRSLQTVRGAMLTLFVCGMVALVVLPNIVLLFTKGELAQSQIVQSYLPYGLLAYFVMTMLTSAGERAIYFSPAEVDHLFSAPFSRRQLLCYKLLGTIISSAIVALIVGVVSVPHFNFIVFGLIGTFLTMLFMNLLAMLITLLGEVVGEHAYTRTRRLIVLAILVIVTVAVSQNIGSTYNGSIGETLREISETPVGRIALGPFQVYCNTMAANSLFPEFANWGLLAITINLALFAAIILLDANYLETASNVSLKYFNLRQRMRSGKGMTTAIKGKSARRRVRMLPFMWGVGPLMWRQLLIVFRTARRTVLLAAIFGLSLGIPIFYANMGRLNSSPIGAGGLVGALAYATLMLSIQLPLAFRTDIENIEVFKSLPIGSKSITLGQLAGAVVLCSSGQLIIMLAALPIVWNWSEIIFTGALFAIPFNIIVFGISNGLFLLYPTPPSTGTSTDFKTTAQIMVFMMMLFLGIGICTMLAIIPAGIALIMSDSWVLAIGIAWVVVVFQSFGALQFVAWAFNRFDVSVHTPV